MVAGLMFEWAGVVMGDLSFGKSFNMLQTDGKDDYFMKMTQDSQVVVKITGYVPYMIRVAALTPWLKAAREYTKFLNWCSDILEERRQVIWSSFFTFIPGLHCVLEKSGKNGHLLLAPRGRAH
jgi:hypothetical protein